MATTRNSNTKLGKPAQYDTDWHLVLDDNADRLESFSPVAGGCVTPAEVPSASLNVRVAPVVYQNTWGKDVSYAGTASQAMTSSSTNYVYIDSAGSLAVSTSSFPASAAHVPLAVVTTDGSTVTGVVDRRTPLRMTVPISQPTMGSATAGGSYGATEQAMLQAVYNAVRNLGLGT